MSRVRITARNGDNGVQAISLTARNPKNSYNDASVLGSNSYQTRLQTAVEPGPYTISILWADGTEYERDVEIGPGPYTRTITGPAMQPPSADVLSYKRGEGPRPPGFGDRSGPELDPELGPPQWNDPQAGPTSGGGWSARSLLLAAAAAALIAWSS